MTEKHFDRVWHDAIWAVLRKYGIDEDIMRALDQLYTKSTSKVSVGAKFSAKFPCSVGVKQGCVLSPSPFNVFLEVIVSRSVEESTAGVCVQGLLVNNLPFADDIALITDNSSDLQDLTNRLNIESTRFGMEISAEKSKIFVVGKTPETLRSPVKLSGKQLEQVKQFKYLGCIMPDTGRSTTEVKIRAAMAMSSLIKMDKLWKSQKISFGVKRRLLRSIVISVLLYGCESWTYSEEILKKLHAFEFKCYRRLLGISWMDRHTNESVKEQVKGFSWSTETPIPNCAGKENEILWPCHETSQ